MKKYILLGSALLISALASVASERIVFIDLERTFEEFYKTQLAKSKVEVQKQDVEAERKVMIDEMTAVSEEVDTLKKEARDSTLAQEIRDGKRILYEERLLDLRDKEKEIKEFAERREQQIQMQVARMSQTIMDEIRQVVVEYAKQEGLSAVIDSSSRRAAVGVFIYTHSDVDITETVLRELNSKRPDVTDEEALPEAPGKNSSQDNEDAAENETM
jgi:Skp family chaperone for outer membrane proteins